MTIGTRSILYGAHQFLIHPWFVAWGWWTLYGFPIDPRLWVAFFVHDIGYVGKPNMDGPEGETHPDVGARVMRWLFDHPADGMTTRAYLPTIMDWLFGREVVRHIGCATWYHFTRYHSRYLAKADGTNPSRLCPADKLAIALTPAWLYLPMVRATGELSEYMAHAKHRIVGNQHVTADEKAHLTSHDAERWYAGVQHYCRRWAFAHADGSIDTWTSDARRRATVCADGVWK